MKSIYLLLFLIVLGCTSQKTIMNSWLGNTKHDLIMSWGPPSTTTSDGNGGQILIYAKRDLYMPQTGVTWWQYKMLYVNSENKIYHWRTEINPEPPQTINLNIYRMN